MLAHDPVSASHPPTPSEAVAAAAADLAVPEVAVDIPFKIKGLCIQCSPLISPLKKISVSI